MTYFTKEDLGEGLYRIHTPFDVFLYLVVGKERAALIDTGYGVGDLKAFVRTITDLPLVVLCTHGHVDHASGTGQFEEAYLNSADLALEREHTGKEKRKSMAWELSGVMPPEEDLIEQRKAPYLPLKDGDVFDLGKATLEMIACPGHTAGCMCVLLRERRLLLLGDASNSRTFLFFPETASVEEYLESLEALSLRESEFDGLLFSHPDTTAGKEIITENMALCRAILEGRDDHQRRMLLGCDVVSAKETDEGWCRLDGKAGNIVYREDHIHRQPA